MSQSNPLWGAPRIHGELLKLGFQISQPSVAKYIRGRERPPSQSWRTFLTNHLQQIAAADFFVVPTATCRLLFVLVMLAHERRRIVHVAVTDHPTSAWTAQQLREAFPFDAVPRYLIHDRDTAFQGLGHDNGSSQHRAGAYSGSVAMAERPCRTSDWVNSPRVSRPRHRGECARPATGLERLRRLLPAISNAPVAEQGLAGAATNLREHGRPHHYGSPCRWPPPPLRPPRGIAASSEVVVDPDGRRMQTSPPSRLSNPPLSVLSPSARSVFAEIGSVGTATAGVSRMSVDRASERTPTVFSAGTARKGQRAPVRDRTPPKVEEFPRQNGSPHWTISATG